MNNLINSIICCGRLNIFFAFEKVLVSTTSKNVISLSTVSNDNNYLVNVAREWLKCHLIFCRNGQKRAQKSSTKHLIMMTSAKWSFIQLSIDKKGKKF